MAISELVSDEVFGEQEFKRKKNPTLYSTYFQNPVCHKILSRKEKKTPHFTVHTSKILYAIKYYLGAMVIWYQEFSEP